MYPVFDLPDRCFCFNPYCSSAQAADAKTVRGVATRLALVDLDLKFMIDIRCNSCGGRRHYIKRISHITLMLKGERPSIRSLSTDIPAPPPFGAGPATQEKRRG